MSDEQISTIPQPSTLDGITGTSFVYGVSNFASVIWGGNFSKVLLVTGVLAFAWWFRLRLKQTTHYMEQAVDNLDSITRIYLVLLW